MSYKKNASTNRDALFGGAAGGGGGKKSSGGGGRPSGEGRSSAAPKNTARGYQSKPAATSRTSSSSSSDGNKLPKCMLSSDAKAAKMKEAEDNKKKATEAMQKSFFSRPDPVAASTFYKRAADCYAALCDFNLERLYRLESAKCNMMIGAWPSAAQDYTKCAEIALMLGPEGLKHNAEMAAAHYKSAGEAWAQQNEKAKAAGCLVKAALALNSNEPGTLLSKDALAGMEEAIEAHVPDVLNPFARYRQTGVSAYLDPDDDNATVEHPTTEMISLARSHLVNRSYAHEPLLDLVYTLTGYGEYASALYATGAARVLLEQDGVSTLTLGRVYVVETILMLAMGDPVAAEQTFLGKHVQSTPYLSSRECKLSEDLFRAVKFRDADALEEARSTSGPNRAGLANLHPSIQSLVQQIRLSGVARKTEESEMRARGQAVPPEETKKKKSPSNRSGKEKSNKPPSPPKEPDKPLNEVLNMKTGYEQEAAEGAHLDGNELANELDALNFAGLDDDEVGGEDDDDFDLR